jgi:DNA-binding GntR family transcriptional regulator
VPQQALTSRAKAAPAAKLDDADLAERFRSKRGTSAPSTRRPSQSMSERVYQAVRELIVAGELPPGAWLVETELAEQFEVSRTPVREALRRLIDEQMVAHDPYRGAVVRAVDLREATEIGEIHEVHDGLAARLATTRATDADLERFDDLLAQMRNSMVGGDWDGTVEANVAFHELIYELAGNSRLHAMAQGLQDSLRRFSAGAFADPERAVQVLAEHERCVETMKSRDPDAAERAARDHGRACMSWTGTWLSNQRQS